MKNAAEKCWIAILNRDIKRFGKYFKDSFEAQVNMFPNMIYNSIPEIINKYKDQALGWKLSGAGGGGYLIFIAKKPIKGAMKIIFSVSF